MELTASSCFLSFKALAFGGPVQEVPAGTGSCLGMPVNPAAVVPTQESWVMVAQGTGGCMCGESTLCMPWLDKPSPRPVCAPAQQS